MATTEYLDFLQDVDDQVLLFKDSEKYESKSWRPFKFLSVSHPIQRKLTERECVFDFDGVSDIEVKWICDTLADTSLKFNAWRSSQNGLHVHFWTDVRGKMAKKSLVRLMAKLIENKFAIVNDLGPMMQEMIRSEWSIHPAKQIGMTKVFDNIPQIDPINIIPSKIKQTVYEGYDEAFTGKGLVGSSGGKMPKCMRLINSNVFSDGRKRLLFVVVSWHKGSGLDESTIIKNATDWCKRQGWSYPNSKIWAMAKSNTGSVGCRYRHELLEELGYEHGCDGKLK